MLFQITNYVEYIVFNHIVQFKIEFEINKCEFKVKALDIISHELMKTWKYVME